MDSTARKTASRPKPSWQTELEVSRATVRTALSTLAAERLIVRRQGDGTYINRKVLDTTIHFGAIAEFTTMITANGHIPTIRALSIDTRDGSDEECQTLQMSPGSLVMVLKRLFLADSLPAIYSINVIPQTILCQPLQGSDIEEPLPKFFKRLCGQEFAYGISNLCAENVTEEIARELQLVNQQSIVCLQEVFYGDKEQPLVAARNYFNSAVLQLKVARSFD